MPAIRRMRRRAGDRAGKRLHRGGAPNERNRAPTSCLHLKDDALEFADAFRLRSLVRKYSDHIGVPVEMRKKTGKDAGATEWESINEAKALWTRPRADITEDEYRSSTNTCRTISREPLTWSHNRVEGKLEYTSLLYVPKQAPFDLWNRDAPRGLKLYVQRVFIMDDAEQFLPLYLRFVKGVVDLQRSAAQRLARDAAAGRACHDDPQRADEARARDVVEARGERAGRATRHSGRNSVRC